MDKKIIIGFFIFLGVLIPLGLWQMGVFKGGPGAVCDPPHGSFGSLKWSEALMNTDGSFYFKLVNPRTDELTIISITIELLMPEGITYTVETPLPLEVKGREEFLVSGRYKPIGSIKKWEEYGYWVHMTYTTTVAGTVIEHEINSGIWGKCGIIERPAPC